MKKSFLKFLFLIVLIGCNFISVAQKKSEVIETINGVKYYMHTVEKGQTLFAISKIYEQGVNDIVIENPDAIDGIQPGQILKILKEKKLVQKEGIDSTKFKYHTVKKKETLYSLSKQYNISIEKLKHLNPELELGLKEDQTIKVGEIKTASNSIPLPSHISTRDTINAIKMDSTSSTYSGYIGMFKDEYNIAFFLPFNAESANQFEILKILKGDEHYSIKTRIAIQFYQGALLAIDSLQKQNLNAKIFVYDVDDADTNSLKKILAKPEMMSMNLIIGPLYGSSFTPVAEFAKKYNIPIVSPLTQANKILFNNKMVCKVSPSTSLQMEQMARFVVDSFSKDNIILINNVLPKEQAYFDSFKDTGNKLLFEKTKKITDTISITKGFSGLMALLNKNKVNVVVLPTSSQSYITEFITKLYAERDKYKIVLFGMQNWTNFDNLDFEYLNSLSLHYPENNFIEFDSTNVKNMISAYRIKNSTEPETYAYTGFDATYYFVSALQKYGTNFLDKISEYKHKGVATNFSFYKFPIESGLENKEVFIVKFQDYKLVNAR